MSEHHGGCLCGGVRYTVSGPLRDVVICHCGRCRRTHGHAAAYTACATVDLELIERKTLRWYEADGRARGFCSECGASLFWRLAGSDSTSISAGTLDPPTGLRTVAQIFTDDRGDYYELSPEGRHLPAGALGRIRQS
ncbi:MAG: GFA family protein [Solirubrobacteraceae bacterium]